MFSAALYAHARTLVHIAHEIRGCSAHPAFPAPSELEGEEISGKSSGAMRRENATTVPTVIARSACDDLSAEAQRAKAEAIHSFFAG